MKQRTRPRGNDPRGRFLPFMLFMSFMVPLVLLGQQRPVFRATTNITQTDVTVLDKDGRPVHGLTIDDFELYEDGEKVDVLGFAEVNIPDAADSPSWMRETSPDVTNALNGRVLLFLLDDAQVPYMMTTGNFIHPDDRIAAVKRIAEQFINRMGPDDVAAVICVYDNRCDLDFTGDHARIRAAVARFSPKGAIYAMKASAGMANSIAKYLQGMNSRRRTIIYITPSEPTRPEQWSKTSLASGGPTEMQIIQTFQNAMRAGITVYSVNPTSLLSLKDAPADDPDAPTPDRPGQFRSRPRTLSAETGGFNISSPRQFAAGVDQIFRETASYYLLGFEPLQKKSAANMISGLRELEVRVKRPDLTVKTHRGYVAMDPPKAPKNPPAESTSALAGVLPKTDLPLRIAVAPFALPGQPEALAMVTVGITEPVTEGQARDYIDVQVRAFTPHGDQRAATRDRIDAHLAPTRTGSSLTEMVSELKLKPGVYEIRASAFSERMGDAGSVYASVEVPDFSKAPLSLSGIVLQAFPKPESLTPNPLSIELPATPTTSRDFTRTSLVRGFVRIYQGGKTPLLAVTVRSTIVDPAGKTVYDHSDSISVDRFDKDRRADARIDVPTGSLQSGLHRLRIEAFAESRHTQRDVVFSMK